MISNTDNSGDYALWESTTKAFKDTANMNRNLLDSVTKHPTQEPLTPYSEIPDEVKTSCKCEPNETCHICKEDKLKLGIAPKFDQGKLRYSLIPPIALEGIAEVLTYGAEKYAPNSWQNVENGKERYLDALYRHLELHRSGEKVDDESGISHLSHALTNLSFLLYFQKNKS